MIRLVVDGVPVPQGSTRAFAVRRGGVPTGRVAVTSDNPRTKPWRQAIVDSLGGAYSLNPQRDYSVRLTFRLPRPKAHYGTGRNADQVRAGAPVWPVGKPDLDKLCRAVLDALTDGGVWRDDAQVVELIASKQYAHGERRPGVTIEVD